MNIQDLATLIFGLPIAAALIWNVHEMSRFRIEAQATPGKFYNTRFVLQYILAITVIIQFIAVAVSLVA